MQYEIISHARTTNIRKLRKLGCARFSAYLDQYITSITQLRLYMQYEIISQAHTTKKYEIKLSCAYTFAQLRLYCIHLRATQAGARTSKLGCTHFSAYLDQYITPIAQLRSPVPGPSVCAGKAPEPLSIAALQCARSDSAVDFATQSEKAASVGFRRYYRVLCIFYVFSSNLQGPRRLRRTRGPMPTCCPNAAQNGKNQTRASDPSENGCPMCISRSCVSICNMNFSRARNTSPRKCEKLGCAHFSPCLD